MLILGGKKWVDGFTESPDGWVKLAVFVLFFVILLTTMRATAVYCVVCSGLFPCFDAHAGTEIDSLGADWWC